MKSLFYPTLLQAKRSFHILSLSLLCVNGLPLTYALSPEQAPLDSSTNQNAQEWAEETPWTNGTGFIRTKDVWQRNAQERPLGFPTGDFPPVDLEADRREDSERNPDGSYGTAPSDTLNSFNRFQEESVNSAYPYAYAPSDEINASQLDNITFSEGQQEGFQEEFIDSEASYAYNPSENAFSLDQEGNCCEEQPCEYADSKACEDPCAYAVSEQPCAVCQEPTPAPCQQQPQAACAPKAYCQSKGLPKLRPLTVIAGLVVVTIVAIVLINSSKTHHHHGKCSSGNCSG